MARSRRRPLFLAGGHVPDMDDVVKPARGQFLAIGREGHTHALLVPASPARPIIDGGHVPALALIAPTGRGGQAFAVRGEGNAFSPTDMLQRPDLLPRFEIPQAYRTVLATGR